MLHPNHARKLKATAALFDQGDVGSRPIASCSLANTPKRALSLIRG